MCSQTTFRHALNAARGRYLVLDVFDGFESVEVLYEGNDLRQARAAARGRIEDTGGECLIRILARQGEFLADVRAL